MRDNSEKTQMASKEVNLVTISQGLMETLYGSRIFFGLHSFML